MPLNETAQLLVGLLDVEFGVVLDGLNKFIVALDGCIMGQYIQDKTFLNGLFHCVAVERAMFHRAVWLRNGFTKQLQGFILRGSGEGKVAGIGQEFLGLYDPVNLVFEGLVFLLGTRLRQGHTHLGRGAAALAGVGLVNNDGKMTPPVLVADFVEDEGELLKSRDYNLLTALDKTPQVTRVFGVPHRSPHLGKLLDSVPDLPVQDTTVGHNNNGIENGFSILRETD